MSLDHCQRARDKALEEAAALLDAEAERWSGAAGSGLVDDTWKDRFDCYSRLLWQMSDKLRHLDDERKRYAG